MVDDSSSCANPPCDDSPLPVNVYSRFAAAQVVVALVIAAALIILSGVQLLFRTTTRHGRLLRVQRQVRFEGAFLLGKPEGSLQRKLVEEGLKSHRFRVDSPPQYNRSIPVVVANSRDSKQDCMEMLNQIRRLLQRSHGRCAELMSMRCCLSCIKGMIPNDQGERFLRIYETVVFGVHRMDGKENRLTSDDVKFLHAFFYNTMLKELQ